MQRDTIKPAAHSLTHSLEALERIFDTIGGITTILEEDALRDGYDGPPSVFSDFHRGALRDAIDQMTTLGYQELQRIDRLISNTPRGEEVPDEHH